MQMHTKVVEFQKFILENTNLDITDHKENHLVGGVKGSEFCPNKLMIYVDLLGESAQYSVWLEPMAVVGREWGFWLEGPDLTDMFCDMLRPTPEECALWEIEQGYTYPLLNHLTAKYKKELGL